MDASAGPEDLLRALRPGAGIGVAVHDDALRVRAITPSLAALGGNAPEEVVGRRVSDVLPGAVGARIDALVRGVVETGEPVTAELGPPPVAGPAGGRWTAHFHPLAVGDSRWVAAIVLDVSEGHTVQERLRESRERLAEVERLARLGSYRWDVGASQWTWSEELFRLAGREPAPAAPTWDEWLATVDAEDRERIAALVGPALCEGRAFDLIFRQLRPDGSARLVRTRGGVRLDAEGRPLRLEGFSQDVSEILRAEQRERVVADLGRLALAGMPPQALAARAAAAAAAALEAPWAAVHRPDGSVLAQWGDASAAGPGAVQARIGPAEAPWGALRVRGASAIEPDGEAFVEAVAAVLTDANARLAAEAEVAAHAAARGRLVAQAADAEERTRSAISAALERGALRELRALAQELDGLQPEGELAHSHAERAREAVGRALAALGEVVLDLGPRPLSRERGGLNASLRALAEQQARIGGFACSVAVAPEAEGSHDDLVVALARELLVNAAKHAEARTVTVDVRRSPDAVVLEVIDDGRGLVRERLRAAVAEGHIGLASSRERAAAVGGHLEVDSPGGRGTRAVAVLPV